MISKAAQKTTYLRRNEKSFVSFDNFNYFEYLLMTILRYGEIDLSRKLICNRKSVSLKPNISFKCDFPSAIQVRSRGLFLWSHHFR